MKKILISGGDMRQIYCAEELAKAHEVYCTGIDSEYFGRDTAVKTLHDDSGFDIAVLPVLPPSESGEISTPLYKGTLYADDVKRLLKADGLVMVGTGADNCRVHFPDNRIVTYMDDESLSIKNAIPSAEGAVQVALEELPVTLNGLDILIVGLGMIGTSLALILKGFGADVTAAVRSDKGTAKARMLGIKAVYTPDISGKYGLVFNTVPSLIFDVGMLRRFSRETLFIDLASRPGGFDRTAAEKLGMKVIWAQGLPGKTAPRTAGIAEAETIRRVMN